MSASVGNDPEFNDTSPKPGSRWELTVAKVVAILAILVLLVALLLPASRSAGPAARRAQCGNNLKQIALALYNYEQAYKALPPACTVDATGRPLHSWRTLILPFLDQEPLYRSIDLSKPWNDPANASALETSINVFRCPEAAGPKNTTTYLAIVAPDGCFRAGKPRPLAEITDAHDSTLMVIEGGETCAVPWMAPVDADESLVMSLGPTMKLHHQGGTEACFVDGHVRHLQASISARARRALISIAGGEKIFDGEF
jgi:prepilin-type processing-associated H-X9-DG protein